MPAPDDTHTHCLGTPTRPAPHTASLYILSRRLRRPIPSWPWRAVRSEVWWRVAVASWHVGRLFGWRHFRLVGTGFRLERGLLLQPYDLLLDMQRLSRHPPLFEQSLGCRAMLVFSSGVVLSSWGGCGMRQSLWHGY